MNAATKNTANGPGTDLVEYPVDIVVPCKGCENKNEENIAKYQMGSRSMDMFAETLESYRGQGDYTFTFLINPDWGDKSGWRFHNGKMDLFDDEGSRFAKRSLDQQIACVKYLGTTYKYTVVLHQYNRGIFKLRCRRRQTKVIVEHLKSGGFLHTEHSLAGLHLKHFWLPPVEGNEAWAAALEAHMVELADEMAGIADEMTTFEKVEEQWRAVRERFEGVERQTEVTDDVSSNEDLVEENAITNKDSADVDEQNSDKVSGKNTGTNEDGAGKGAKTNNTKGGFNKGTLTNDEVTEMTTLAEDVGNENSSDMSNHDGGGENESDVVVRMVLDAILGAILLLLLEQVFWGYCNIFGFCEA